MAIVCYDVDNLVLYQLDLRDISNLIQTNKYWQKRMRWFVRDYQTSRRYATFYDRYRGFSLSIDFRLACWAGLFQLVKWLRMKAQYIDYFLNFQLSFEIVCRRGHFEITEYFLNCGYVSNKRIIEVFINCIEYNNLKAAKWLWEKRKDVIDINNMKNDTWIGVFFWAYDNNYKHMVEWLCRIEPKFKEYQKNGFFQSKSLE